VHVIHIAESVKGGIESYLSDLHPLLQKEVQLTYILPHNIKSIPSEQTIIVKSSRTPISQLKYAYLIYKQLKQLKPEIVHAHSSLAGAAIRVLKMLNLTRAKIVYCPHGWPYIREDGYAVVAYKIIEKCLSIFTDKIVAISDYEKEISICPSKTIVINNGIADFSVGVEGECPAKKSLLYIGRFDRAKGVDLLIKSYNKVQPDFDLVLVGDSVLNDVEIPEVSSGIKCAGWVERDDLKRYFNEASAVVIPSRWDGFNLVAIEAMSFGLPVFASNVGGLKDIVDSTSGKLFELTKIDELLIEIDQMSVSEMRSLGFGAREKFKKHFTVDRVSAKLINLYNDIN
tara:strand:- start:7413 stop:8438 length:1026 start_codon:yes stop_codon:yes gene_type:complete